MLYTIVDPIGITITGNRILNESGTLILTCSANRTAKLTWQKQNENGDGITTLTSSTSQASNSKIFTIQAVYGSDSGTYYCVAQSLVRSSTLGEVRVSHHVTVNGMYNYTSINNTLHEIMRSHD